MERSSPLLVRKYQEKKDGFTPHHFMYYVYLLKSTRNNRIYIGSTNDLGKRLKEHNEGKVFSTKCYIPWVLFYYEAYNNENSARMREKRLKYNGNALRELRKRIGLLPTHHFRKKVVRSLSTKIKSSAGFTLPEILVVMFIITLLGGITFANYHQGGKEMALQRSAYKLAQDMRRAQEMAIGAKECAPCGNTIPLRYGLYLPELGSVYYLIFADLNLPKGDGLYTPPPDKLIETINFENGVSYLDVSGVGCSGSFPAPGLRRIHLTFSPPDPTTEIKVGWGASIVSCSEISVTLRFGGTGGPTRLVKINRVGMIEIK